MLTFFETMLMNEKQRAYRYGMTLLCIGAFFNWLGINEDNSDPLRFIGFTCLSSGALLVCMAICLWANTSRQPQLASTPSSGGRSEGVDSGAAQEKPPDYETVTASATPPPSYRDAIRLSPLYLTDLSAGEVSSCVVTVEPEGSKEEEEGRGGALSRVLRLSSRWLRRTVSQPEPAVHRPPLARSPSAQDPPKDC